MTSFQSSTAIQEISVVGDLKRELRRLHGFPLCMQQLLQSGNILDDFSELDAPAELQLVLLSSLSSAIQQGRADSEFVDACAHGQLETARLLLEAGALAGDSLPFS